MKILQTNRPELYSSFRLGRQPDELFFEVPDMKNFNNLGYQLAQNTLLPEVESFEQIGERIFVVRFDKRKIQEKEIIKFAKSFNIEDK